MKRLERSQEQPGNGPQSGAHALLEPVKGGRELRALF